MEFETMIYRVLRERLAGGPGRVGPGDFALREAAAAVAEEFRKAIGILPSRPGADIVPVRRQPMLRLVPKEPEAAD